MLISYLIYKCEQIDDANDHEDDSSDLAGDGITSEAHEKWEYGTSEESHYHQSADGVLLPRHVKQCLGEAHGEDITVAVAHEGYAAIEYPLCEDGIADGRSGVPAKDRRTVFFLPILFISTPVGTEKIITRRKPATAWCWQ